MLLGPDLAPTSRRSVKKSVFTSCQSVPFSCCSSVIFTANTINSPPSSQLISVSMTGGVTAGPPSVGVGGTQISVQEHQHQATPSSVVRSLVLTGKQTDFLRRRFMTVYDHGTKWPKCNYYSLVSLWFDKDIVDLCVFLSCNSRNRPAMGLESEDFLHATSDL